MLWNLIKNLNSIIITGNAIKILYHNVPESYPFVQAKRMPGKKTNKDIGKSMLIYSCVISLS
jgi:hypothetical protein